MKLLFMKKNITNTSEKYKIRVALFGYKLGSRLLTASDHNTTTKNAHT